MTDAQPKRELPEDLQKCVEFHGHICPGLIYGYRVAKEAMRLMNLSRSRDEEVVAVCENDSCAVDALQVLLGTVAGKGNLIISDFGKNAYTVLSRTGKRAYRFSRRTGYAYAGGDRKAFEQLEAAVAANTASEEDQKKLKSLKINDLLQRPFDEIFTTCEAPFAEPPYAPLAPSEPCAVCGEMTMKTKMTLMDSGEGVCGPCLCKIQQNINQ
ncbi:MAG: hypothetical protein KBA28_02385 [Syntrophaceae bacterium]|jgi:formylmethanofuran dehydrogenase subunit E|nr:hypothetical protein [Syntrophaceae bacterium]